MVIFLKRKFLFTEEICIGLFTDEICVRLFQNNLIGVAICVRREGRKGEEERGREGQDCSRNGKCQSWVKSIWGFNF